MEIIRVTANNFEEVLKKIQKVCNKYRMLHFYKVFSENMTENKQYRRASIGFRSKIRKYSDKNGNRLYKKSKQFVINNGFIWATKHSFRKKFEYGVIDSYDVESYLKSKPLIHMDISGGSALVIHEGDKIQFLPCGGFRIWTDSSWLHEHDYSIYQDTYIPDYIRGIITDLEKERVQREKEWEEETEWEYKMMNDEIEDMLDYA